MRRSAVLVLTLVVVLGGIVLGGRARLGDAQESTPADCPATSPEENEALVHEFLDTIYNQHSTASVDAHLHDDYVRTNAVYPSPNEPGNADEIAFFEESLVDFPDFALRIEFAVAGGDMVGVRTIATVTHQDDIEHLGIPATGAGAEYAGHSFYRIECGLIVESWAISDAFSLFRQLGVIHDDELTTIHPVATPEP